MNKNIKKPLKISAFFAIIVAIFGIGIFFLEQKIKTQIKDILSETLEPNVDSVKINLSFFHRFPHPYLRIQNLIVSHLSDSINREILRVQEMNAEVNFLKLLKGDYEIKSVNIQDANLLFYTDSLGENIRLFKYKEAGFNKTKRAFFTDLCPNSI